MSILTIILCLRSSPFLKASLTIFQVRTPSTYNASGHDCYCMLDSDLHLADDHSTYFHGYFYAVFCIIAYVEDHAFGNFPMQYDNLDQNRDGYSEAFLRHDLRASTSSRFTTSSVYSDKAVIW